MPPTPRPQVVALELQGFKGTAKDRLGGLPGFLSEALINLPGLDPSTFCVHQARVGRRPVLHLCWVPQSADQGLQVCQRLSVALLPQQVTVTLIEPLPSPVAQFQPSASTDLCIELTSPWALPCDFQSLRIHSLYTLLRARLRRLGGRACKSLGAALEDEERALALHNPNAKLLSHLARHWPPQPIHAPPVDDDAPTPVHALWGLGRHGHLRGSLFLRAPPPILLLALEALESLHGLALSRRGKGLTVITEGAYRLRWQQAPWLDQAVLHRKRLLAQARLLCEQRNSPTLSDESGRLLSPEQATDRLLRQAQQQSWLWEPNLMHLVPKPDHAPRAIEVLSPLHSLWQRHLLRVLSKAWEPLFSSNSYGFRPGLGAHTALAALREALSEGYTYVVRTDISRCFDSVSHDLMMAAVNAALPQCDQLSRASIANALTQPHILAAQHHERKQGLVQGAPLSPLLLNLFLTPLDQQLGALQVFTIRYADDILVLARSRTQAQQSLSLIKQGLSQLQLQVAPEKTLVHHIKQGFQFLGQHFDGQPVEVQPTSLPAQRKPLIISWPWMQLGVNGASLEAKREGQVIGRWPLRRLSAVVLLSPCNLSTTLIERCLKQDVTLGLTLHTGRQHLVMPPLARHTYDLAHQHALWHSAMSPTQRLANAQSLVDAKLHNMGMLVAQRTPRSPLRSALREIQAQVVSTSDLATLRGYEGYAARLCFKWLNEQVRADLRQHFNAPRRARGAPDRLNSLLNLGYYFLAARLRVWVRLQALNPYLAWLHDADDPYETLVYDLMEPFRPFVDRLVLRYINRQEVRADHFAKEPGHHRLSPQAAARFAQAFEATLGERVGAHLLRDLIWLQARAVRAAIQQPASLWVFRWQARAPDSSPEQAVEPLLWMAEEGDGWSKQADEAALPPPSSLPPFKP